MSRLSEEKYTEIVTRQANEINKRMTWIEEMKQMDKYKPFAISTTNSPFFKHVVDLRDLYSLSTLIPKKGESEEEIKKNFQDEVHNLYNAFMNGPLKDVSKYLDQLIDLTLNFDESKLDYSKDEDVYKAISVASLGQCFGTEKANFKYYYDSKINSKEAKEKYYYRNIVLHEQVQDIFNDVEKRVHLEIGVTIKPIDFSQDVTYTSNRKNLNDRDLKQVEYSIAGSDEVANLEYIVKKSFANVNNPNTTVRAINNSMDVNLGVDLIFGDLVLPGNTEGKPEIELYNFTYQDVVFINGKPLSEAMKGSRFDESKDNSSRKMVAYLTEQLTKPDSMIEVCKLIPIGENKFKNQFITIHKNFSDYDPTLQAQHDEAYNAYIKEGFKQHREAEIKHVAKVFDNIKTKEAQSALEKAEHIQAAPKQGARPNYNDYDPFFKDNTVTKNALTRLENVFNVGNKFNQILTDAEKERMSTIEERQGLGMAMIMAGKNATIEDIYKKRFEVANAYSAGGEFKREYNRQFINKVLDYDFTKAASDNENDLYEYMSFVFGSSAISNIFEEDKELEKEFNSNPITRNKLAVKAVYTNGVSEFLGGKFIELMNGIPFLSYNVHHFDSIGDTDAATLSSLEAKRILFDITNAKANAVINDITEHKLTVPYFLSGNACGGEGEYYSLEQSQRTVDDYLNCYDVDDNELVSGNTTLNEANATLLSVGTGNALLSALSYQFQTANKDNIAEFADANNLDYVAVTELCTYINGVSLKELVDAKYNEVIVSKNLNTNEMVARQIKHTREAVTNCILAEAIANPEKNISVVFLKSNENNILEAKTTLLKKDYTAMVKNAKKQHSVLDKILHFFHIKTYDEERVANNSRVAVNNYKTNNQAQAVTEAFKATNEKLLKMHQAKYASTHELQQKAFKEIYPEKTVKRIREQFLNDNVEVEESKSKEAEAISRPKLDKLSKVTTSAIPDDIEVENFNKKFTKKISVDIPKENEEIEELPDSIQEDDNIINISEIDNDL